MNLASATQLRKWDAFTIKDQGISFWVLMERAAGGCVHWLTTNYPDAKSFVALCGTGNNGGDGLAIIRQLLDKGFAATAIVIRPDKKTLSADAEKNLSLLPEDLAQIHGLRDVITVPQDAVLIDCLFGTGLNRPLGAEYKALVGQINEHKGPIVSIDLPSGLLADMATPAEAPVVRATHTLSFEAYKLALLAAPNAAFFGDVQLLSIGLSNNFWGNEPTKRLFSTDSDVRSLYKPRSRFTHKGDFGHAVIIGGSKGMMGAALMSVGTCLRSGVGLCTAVVPGCGYLVLQITHPEAMCLSDATEECITVIPPLPKNTTAVGLGPGLGKNERTEKAVLQFLSEHKLPVVIDADGLNILSRNKKHLRHLPPNSILTPHPKEFDRLFHCGMDWWEQLQVAQQQAQALQAVIVLKGHHSIIASPDGRIWFNTTGNNALAKGGSGDVLTGLITGLLAQGYSAFDAARLGVWLHGRAADIAVQSMAAACFLPTDMTHYLSAAFRELTASESAG